MALAVGPAAVSLTKRAPSAGWAIDGFVIVSLLGLVFTAVLPHAISVSGLWALGFMLIGVVWPLLFERWLSGPGHHHQAVTTIGLLGLAVHALLDGSVMGHEGPKSPLSLGIVLHRIPVGIAIWTRLPRLRASLVLGSVALATVLGFALGEQALTLIDFRVWGYFEALVAGMLIHIAFEPSPTSSHDSAGHPKDRLAGGLGALLGLFFFLFLSEQGHGHDHETLSQETIHNATETFIQLALESSGPLLLGFLGASLLCAWLPALGTRWLKAPHPSLEALKGMIFGLPLPLCSCGVVPVYQSLWRSGAPTAAAIAFLVATPEVGIDAFLLSMALLGTELAITRILVAAVIAFLVGIVLAKYVPPNVDHENTHVRVGPASFVEGLRYGFGPLFRHTMPWILLGLGVAALLDPVLAPNIFVDLPQGLDVAIMAIVGFPAYVCASGATPFVAVLLFKGLSPGAAIAFLITGPATNLTTVLIMKRLHGKKAALFFAAFVPALSIATGILINLTAVADVRVSAPQRSSHESALLDAACLSILALITIWHLIRVGPRSLLAEVLEGLHDHEGHGDHAYHGE